MNPVPENQTRVIRVYTYDTFRRYGLAVWPHMFQELYTSRDLIWILAWRNITARYRQSILSFLWIIVPPVFAASLFSYLISYRIVSVGDTSLPYLSYALLNTSIWLLFSNALMSATRSLVDAGTLVTRVNFPKATLVIASIADALLEFCIRLFIVGIVFYVQEVNINIAGLLSLFLMIPLILLALGLGFLLSILNLIARDIASVLGIALTVGMFMTPVLYPPPKLEPFVYLNLLNPISPVLENTHALIIDGQLADGNLLTLTIGLSVLIFLAGWRVFTLTMPRINERA